MHDTSLGAVSLLIGVCNRQPLADDKGVHCDVESEGSLRQIPALRKKNHIRHIHWDESAKQIKAQRLLGQCSINIAGRGVKVKMSYYGRSHGRIETENDIRTTVVVS